MKILSNARIERSDDDDAGVKSKSSSKPVVLRNETDSKGTRHPKVKSDETAYLKGGKRHAYDNPTFYNATDAIADVPGCTKPSTSHRNQSTVMNSDQAEETKPLSNGQLEHMVDVELGIYIQRSPADLSYMERKYGMVPSENLSQKIKRTVRSRCACSCECFLSFITSIFPILTWLPKYKMEYLLPDAISGFTISILHVPQGLAYGVLASLKAENGLYVSFFPVLFYFILGTSRHISIGTFAVISLMTSSAIDSVESVTFHEHLNSSSNTTFSPLDESDALLPTTLEVATSLALGVGLIQLFMGFFHLGSLSVLLSDQLVSGFTTAAAFHVASSQINGLFGLSLARYSGPLKLIYVYRDIFEQMKQTNVATVIISAISIFVLALVKEQINDRYRDKLKMPLPIDIFVVIVATVVSYAAGLREKYNVAVIGHIPTGLPEPVSPRLDLIPQILPNSFAIAIVVFAISLAMAKLFAKKHRYEINANQELIALGAANAFSSFFACYPCSASLARSLVQERTGCQTQVAGIVSCMLLLLVLLVLAPLFQCLPNCILSAVILVALKGMFLQVKDFIKAWGISKIDAYIWLVTFLSTVILDISYGLLVGVSFSVITVILRTVLPYKTFLGNVIGTDLYIDVQRYSEAKEISGVKIFHFESALYFMNRELFKSYLFEHVPISPKTDPQTKTKNCFPEIHHIIIDCSSFSYVDMPGLETLLEVMKEYKEIDITVFLAGCSVSMYDMIGRAHFFNQMPQHPSVFPTIHDAVQFCNKD